MAIKIGIGVSYGTLSDNSIPPTVLDGGPALITAASDIVVASAEALSVDDPLSIVTSLTWRIHTVADIGVVEGGGAGTGVTGWTDRSVGGNSWVNATGGTTLGALGAASGPGGLLPCITLDGVNDFLRNAYDPPVPASGANSVFIRMIAKVVSTVNAGQMICGSASNRLGWATLTGNTARPGNGVNGGTSAYTIGTWYVWDALFSNTTGDYLWVGANKTTGTALGNTDNSAIGLGARSDGAAVFSNIAVYSVDVLTGGEPSGPERTNWNSYITKWTKGNVVLPT